MATALSRFRFRAIVAVGCLTAGLGFPAHSSSAGEGAEARCACPTELIRDDPKFPVLSQRLLNKEPISIVVIGGSSTVGAAAGEADSAYPHQLELALHSRYPGVPIKVLNRGALRETAQQMAARLERDALAEKPNLVIWEVGITDAVRNTDVEAFATALQTGIAQLQHARVEVMLIDMQFSPDTASVINYAPYLDALHQAGDLADAYVFQRYAIMKHWSDSGSFQLSDVPKEERPKLAAKIYACLGERLADAIAYATR